MAGLFMRSGRRLAALLAGLALLIAAPALAEATFTYTLPNGQQGVIVLPPVEEFQEGDYWNAYAADATADMNANTAFKGQVSYSFVKKDGAWAQANLDIDAMMRGEAEKGRHFKDLGRDPPAYPQVARQGALFATDDGILHRFDGAQWVTVPIGSALDTPDGKHLTIDRRVLPAEAARADAAFQKAEAAAQASAQTPPVAPPTVPQTTTTTTDDRPKGGVGVFVLVILIIAGAWAWWWFGPRRKAIQARAAATPPSEPDTFAG